MRQPNMDKVITYVDANKNEINEKLKKLSDFDNEIKMISDYFKIQNEWILVPFRNRSIVFARQCLATILRKEYTLEITGELIGGYDHTTVIHCIKTINDIFDTEPRFRNFYNELLQSYTNRKILSLNTFTSLRYRPN